jgi:hypothetical protein
VENKAFENLEHVKHTATGSSTLEHADSGVILIFVLSGHSYDYSLVIPTNLFTTALSNIVQIALLTTLLTIITTIITMIFATSLQSFLKHLHE